MMQEQIELAQIEEAIAVGKEAMLALDKVERYLTSARNWGILDILGGDMITSWIKRSKMSKAQQYIQEAQMHLSYFQKELADVNLNASDLAGFGQMSGFFDVFLDDLIVDLYVQNKIAEARQKLAVTKEQVNLLLERLIEMKKVHMQMYIG